MNLDLLDLCWWLLGGFAGAVWWRGLAMRERAQQAVAKRCRELDLQFLDQAVVLSRIGLRRGPAGWPCVSRSYVFEFSSTGAERYRGRVIFLGARLQSTEVSPHRYTTPHPVIRAETSPPPETSPSPVREQALAPVIPIRRKMVQPPGDGNSRPSAGETE